MNTSVVMALLVTFVVGGAAGVGMTHLMTTTQVTCAVPANPPPQADGMAQLLKPQPVPLTGYRSY